ncbi:1-deoxy-D-xylulose-5-phosphate synthase [Anaeromicropila herbilytica]|uniref:1-deoxy-D-xylulose-5-phosphate synthase n=1 Tax=Anaeromicropila herbilytica TaxID=2785025 RepID=A0A7R7EKH1_9FIRM|nr:1-deoxy-D-xylulose-5-phosphate synthase [Anaeromicropila herbilytica]BCN30404.1 1-deoxy-D-xylulose-5-phosphate synthase [Anaeromicropila herbilytica]
MSDILDRINEPNDIKNIEPEEYSLLAKEIRRFLVDRISKTGGHLASNLGVVELTMAMHLCLDLPKDKIVWDVGHQSYTHKILTGRKDMFMTLRKYGGLSGFPKCSESCCDSFNTGHSSTSISAALGLAKARELKKEDSTVFAVIGDGALSGGMAYEALNNAARLKSNLVIVLNDNNMSISENVGGMATYLGKIRTNTKYLGLKDGVEGVLKKVPMVGDFMIDRIKKSKDSIKRLVIPGMLFEDMGLTYIGPIDGHNMEQLVTAFRAAKQMKEAVIVHVVTKKGKGYRQAELNPPKFHGVDPFDIKSGKSKKEKNYQTYTDYFSEALVELAKEDERIVAITAAMPSGTGLTQFQEKYKSRFFDVGIAEEHAVTFAAGLAAGGLKPVVAIYSTFLQRAYDQILHDVCISNLPVIFAIDRAGIVGSDGDTHQGIFDISFLSSIPNLTIMAPKNGQELKEMLRYGVNYDGPIAIRYPRGESYNGLEEFHSPIEYSKSEIIYQEKEIALLAVGSMVQTAVDVREELKKLGHSVTLINARFIAPIDEDDIATIASTHNVVVTLEENVLNGGYGQAISHIYSKKHLNESNLLTIALPNEFLPHGDCDILKAQNEIDAQSIVQRIQSQI